MENLMFLDKDHPSASTPAAAFVFRVNDGILFVEAQNNLAVQAMELLCGEEGCPANGLELMGVFRDYGIVGIRSDDFVGMDYVDFLIKVADKEKISVIPGLKECIAASLSASEREYMAANIRKMRTELQDIEDDCDNESNSSLMLSDASKELEANKLENALTGLGFKKKAVLKFIESVDPRIGIDPIEKLVREGLRNLAT